MPSRSAHGFSQLATVNVPLFRLTKPPSRRINSSRNAIGLLPWEGTIRGMRLWLDLSRGFVEGESKT